MLKTKRNILPLGNFGDGTFSVSKKYITLVTQRKVAVEYVELCGLKHGQRGDYRQSAITQSDIAKQLGINERGLRELLEIERKLTPEIKELLDDGIISKTSASKIWTKYAEFFGLR